MATTRKPAAPATKGAEAPAAGPEPPSGAALRILLVDDDPLVRASVPELLTLQGHKVASFPGGREALEALDADAAWDLVKGFDAETRQGLRVAASVSALQGEAGGVKLLDLARAAVALSQAGLAARGHGEERLLAPLMESLASGRVQADRWLELYRDEWGGSLAPIYEAASL